MEPKALTTNSKLEPGVFQGTPGASLAQKNVDPSAPRLLRTMKSDAEDAIKSQHETSVSIAIAEEKKREQERVKITSSAQAATTPVAQKRVARVFVIIGLTLIVIALVLAYLFALPKIKNIKLPAISLPSFSSGKVVSPTNVQTVAQAAPIAPSLIPAQTEKRFNISKENPTQVFSSIASEHLRGTSVASIENIYFVEGTESTQTPISATQFISFANTGMPEILTRSLEKPFMVGLIGETTGSTPFLVLKVSGYDTGLAGMLEWESALPLFFNTVFGTQTGGPLSSTMKFKDIVVSWRDARAADVASENSISYAFANPDTIIITGSRTSLETIMGLATKI